MQAELLRQPVETEGGTGTRTAGEEGAMGHPTTERQNGKYGVKGHAQNPDPHVARAAALEEAKSFGTIKLLHAMNSDPDAPTAPWGRDTSLGLDDEPARGLMWGGDIRDAFGHGGLGLSGIGETGGGRGAGIGMGNIGTISHGSGTGLNGQFGPGGGLPDGKYRPKTPSMTSGDPLTSGQIPREVIQRVVRQNYGRFRLCYERGLMSNPNLEGRVTTRFVIGRDGAVSQVQNGASDLPDSSVVSCVISQFYGLSFPAPEDGIVTVVYPIMFTPG